MAYGKDYQSHNSHDSEEEYNPKRNALQKMKKEMKKDAKYGGMGVTVKAKDKEGLLEGLEKAGEIIEKPEALEEMAEDSELSQDEIKEQIAKLQEMLGEE